MCFRRTDFPHPRVRKSQRSPRLDGEGQIAETRFGRRIYSGPAPHPDTGTARVAVSASRPSGSSLVPGIETKRSWPSHHHPGDEVVQDEDEHEGETTARVTARPISSARRWFADPRNSTYAHHHAEDHGLEQAVHHVRKLDDLLEIQRKSRMLTSILGLTAVHDGPPTRPITFTYMHSAAPQ